MSIKLSDEIYTKLRKVLTSPFRVVLFTHINPDGDAIGSMLGLYHFLKNRGCTLFSALFLNKYFRGRNMDF